jgi:HSP20 family protein
MNLIKWDPFREMNLLRQDVNRWLGGVARPSEGTGLEPWVPAVDVYEDENAITLKVDLPEVEKKDIEIDINDDTLSIRGERKLEKEEKRDNYHRVERSYGTFFRSFSIPDYVDQKKISAESKDGVLKVTLPKTKVVKPEAVKVQVK